MPPTSAPPPPPPPGVDSAPGLPWENRTQLGFGPALVETVKLVVTAPGEAFSRMREKGDLFEALIFGVIPGSIGFIVSTIWSAMFTTSWLAMMPGPFRERFGPLMGVTAASVIGKVIFSPLLITI